MSPLDQPATPAYRAAIIGGDPGRPLAAHRYPLGMAWDPEANVYVVTLVEPIPLIGITFSAGGFDDAFERAISIGTDMAASAGHLAAGVVISLEAFPTLADIGIDAD